MTDGARFFGHRRRVEPLRPILMRALARNGVGRKLPRLVGVATWIAAVGEQIAARARPTVLSAGILHVLVEDHRWRDQLDAARNLLIARINEKLGGPHVRALQFGLAHCGAFDEGRWAPPESELDPRDIEPSRVLGDARLDGRIREALLRAAEAACRRARA